MKKLVWMMLLLGGLVLAGCSGEASGDPFPIGLWEVPVAKVGGRNISDGKNFFQFNPDNTINTRSAPGTFISGTYKLDETAKTITLSSGPSSMVYNYSYSEEDGVLRLNTTLDGGIPLEVEAVRTDELPVREEDEEHLKDALPPAPIQ